MWVRVAVSLGLMSTALAQQFDSPPPQEDAPKTKYQGVVPEIHDEPPMPVPSGAPPQLTWTGFQRLDKRAARVFLQFTGEPTYAGRRDGEKFILEITGATVYTRNNQRHLDTRHFGTVVKTLRVRKSRKAVLVEISADTSDTPVVQRERSGRFHYLYIDYPAPPEPIRTEPASQEHDRERPE